MAELGTFAPLILEGRPVDRPSSLAPWFRVLEKHRLQEWALVVGVLLVLSWGMYALFFAAPGSEGGESVRGGSELRILAGRGPGRVVADLKRAAPQLDR